MNISLLFQRILILFILLTNVLEIHAQPQIEDLSNNSYQKIRIQDFLNGESKIQKNKDKKNQKDFPQLEPGFVYLSSVDSTIVQNLRYYTKQNFVGDIVDGYFANKVIVTKQAAEALSRVQKKLNKDGYKIVVYDSYRPQKAVNHFVRWADDPNALQQKAKYYPYIDKSQLFDEGYIAKKSGHSRGSTVDISIIKIKENLKPIDFKIRTLKNNQIIMLLDDGTEDFGSSFDLFSEASHPENNLLDNYFIQKRKYLIQMMKSQKFNVLSTQWWHYTLQNEPFPNTYFDFDIV